MAYGKQKIIDFNDAHSVRRMSKGKQTNNQLVSDSKKVLTKDFSKILKSFFEKIDDELFALSDKAENSTLQGLYFDSMRYVRKERSRMQSNYLNLVGGSYDDFWKGKIKGKNQAGSLEEDEFSLIENEILEEDLAIITMTDKGENRYYKALFALNKRFAVLRGVDEVDNRINPVAPATLCKLFQSTLEPMLLELEIKLVIYKLFDRLVLSQLGSIYDELNALLIRQGVLPVIQKRVKRQSSSAISGRASGGGASDLTGEAVDDKEMFDAEMDPAQLEFFRSLQNLLGAHRQQQNGPLATGEGVSVATGPVYNINEVMDVLSLAQADVMEGTLSSIPNGIGVKPYLSNALGRLQPGGEQRPFASMDEDVIDMVGMIFDFILEDKNLPDPLKALLGRLQIPVLKIAILDKGFFGKKGHPARLLLNRLSKAGVELSVDECNEKNPVYAEIESLVNQLLNDFEQNGELFEVLLDEFNEFLSKDEKRCQVLEERTMQVAESKEQLLLAKKQTAYEIARQMQGKKMPAVVKEFVEDNWKDVILLAALRKDKEPKGLERSVALIKRLINSVNPPSSKEERQQILRDIPLILKEIRIGLENISFDPHQMAEIFKDLEQCHVASLKEKKADEPIEVDNEVQIPARSEEELEAECSAFLNDLTAIQPDSSGFSQENESTGSGIEEIVLSSASVIQEEDADDGYLEKAASAKVGQWFELDFEDKKAIRVKLSWKSQVTSMYVFVDRKGLKVAEMSQQSFAIELRRGSARSVEKVGVPLMERALAAMMDKLKSDPEVKGAVTA